jgi:hypothetical protein
MGLSRNLPRLILLAWIPFAAGMVLPGCDRRPFYEYADEPYIQDLVDLGEETCMKKLHSVSPHTREVSLRAMAVIADRRATADPHARERIANALISHFSRERNVRLRSIIEGICLRRAGSRSDTVRDFLRKRIALAPAPGEACKSLALLRPDDARASIAPLLHHPCFEARYNAAIALTTIDDKHPVPALEKMLSAMREPDYPSQICGMPLDQCKRNLSERLRRMRNFE